MFDVLVPVLAALAYLAAAALLLRQLRREPPAPSPAPWLTLPALALHSATHGLGWAKLHAPDLHFFAALSLVGLGMAALTTAAARSQRLAALGIVVYPLA